MAILAAIDETERAKRIVPLAYDLATAYDDVLIVLHVVPIEDYEDHKEDLESIHSFGDFSLSQEEDSASKYARRVVDQTVGDAEVDIEPRGRVGDVAEETLAEADSVDPRYLVISGERRSPAGKAIFGSAAQKILLRASCPVVTKMGE